VKVADEVMKKLH